MMTDGQGTRSNKEALVWFFGQCARPSRGARLSGFIFVHKLFIVT